MNQKRYVHRRFKNYYQNNPKLKEDKKMAEASNKVADNVEGEYYVDEQCISCEVCVSIAPDNMKMKDDGSYAFVYKQPENDEEKEACEQAIQSCPVDAIGNDG